MKRITVLFAMVLVAGTVLAQGKAPLSKGEKQLNFGVGFDGGVPVYVGIDYAVHDDITIGGNIGFDLTGFDYMNLTVRGDYHWNRLIGIPDNWDFYAGVNFGGAIGLSKYYGNGLHVDIHVGGRYYWDEKWGINLELGGGTGFASSLGVSMKL